MWTWSASTRWADCSSGCKTNQSFDSLDLFQLGGVIFF